MRVILRSVVDSIRPTLAIVSFGAGNVIGLGASNRTAAGEIPDPMLHPRRKAVPDEMATQPSRAAANEDWSYRLTATATLRRRVAIALA